MSKFVEWVDAANLLNSTLSVEEFNNDSQRKSGFKAGTAASSIRVNTALRQSSLVVSAFMDLVDSESKLDLRSTRTSVMNMINDYFNKKYNLNIMLNGVTTKEPKFYAPKIAGVQNDILISKGNDTEPAWQTPSKIKVGKATHADRSDTTVKLANNRITLTINNDERFGGIKGQEIKLSSPDLTDEELSKVRYIAVGTGKRDVQSEILIGRSEISPYGITPMSGFVIIDLQHINFNLESNSTFEFIDQLNYSINFYIETERVNNTTFKITRDAVHYAPLMKGGTSYDYSLLSNYKVRGNLNGIVLG